MRVTDSRSIRVFIGSRFAVVTARIIRLLFYSDGIVMKSGWQIEFLMSLITRLIRVTNISSLMREVPLQYFATVTPLATVYVR